MSPPRITKRRRHPERAANTPIANAELAWLQEEIEQSHLILDNCGVARTAAVNHETNHGSITLTLAGRLRLLLDDSPRKPRHAAAD